MVYSSRILHDEKMNCLCEEWLARLLSMNGKEEGDGEVRVGVCHEYGVLLAELETEGQIGGDEWDKG